MKLLPAQALPFNEHTMLLAKNTIKVDIDYVKDRVDRRRMRVRFSEGVTRGLAYWDSLTDAQKGRAGECLRRAGGIW